MEARHRKAFLAIHHIKRNTPSSTGILNRNDREHGVNYTLTRSDFGVFMQAVSILSICDFSTNACNDVLSIYDAYISLALSEIF